MEVFLSQSSELNLVHIFFKSHFICNLYEYIQQIVCNVYIDLWKRPQQRSSVTNRVKACCGFREEDLQSKP
jgi:hypothetical protein